MNAVMKGAKAAVTPRGIGGLIVILGILVALSYVGWGPDAIAARVKARGV